jgi:hypothetical protein
MKKISIIGAALVLLGTGFQSANAGLLGMPLNLRAAIAQVDLDGSASTAIFRQQSCGLFYTDDVLTGPLLVSSC